MRQRRRIPATTTKAALAIAVLAASVAAAAAAFGGGGGHGAQSLRERIQERRKALMPRPIDLASFASQPALPTDPVQRANELRKIVYVLSANDYITEAQAKNALREIRQTGTLGRSVHPVALRVRALSALPPQANVPAEVARFVGYVGELTHSGPADPGSVRLLRTNLGSSRTDVYGIRSAAGSPCFISTGYGGTCAGSSSVARSGVSWIVGGATDRLPGVFVGLAADDVRSVRLTVDGGTVPVSLESNVAFAELPRAGQAGVVSTARTGGRMTSEEIPIAR